MTEPPITRFLLLAGAAATVAAVLAIGWWILLAELAGIR